jgi:hypothetical protein
MGIYIFKHKDTNWIKVGYHGSRNPYRRLLYGGFNSVICPEEIRGHAYYTDMELLCWFPNLSKKVERGIHRKFKDVKTNGEWYNISFLEDIVTNLSRYERDQSTAINETYYHKFLTEEEMIQNNHGTLWSKSEKHKLKMFIQNNIPIEHITRFLGRTINSVLIKSDEVL